MTDDRIVFIENRRKRNSICFDKFKKRFKNMIVFYKIWNRGVCPYFWNTDSPPCVVFIKTAHCKRVRRNEVARIRWWIVENLRIKPKTRGKIFGEKTIITNVFENANIVRIASSQVKSPLTYFVNISISFWTKYV